MATLPSPLLRNSLERKHSVSRKIVIYIVCVGIVVALIATAIQLYRTYHNETEELEGRMATIASSYLYGIRSSLWDIDVRQTQAQLRGLLQIPDIVYVKVEGPTISPIQLGELPSNGQDVTRSYPLWWEQGSQQVYVGELTVTASFASAYKHVWDAFIRSLITTFATVMAIAVCILLIVQRTITRHLDKMAVYTQQFSLDNLHEPLQLDRPQRANRRDELDIVAQAINSMRQTLIKDLEDKTELHAEVERKQMVLQTFLDHSPAVIYIKDSKGRFIFVNREFERLVAMPASNILGKTEKDIFPAEFSNLMQENNDIVLAEKKPVECEEQAPQFVDQQIRTYMSIKFPLQMTESGGWCVAGISTDITDRKRAQEALQQSEARLRALVESLDDAVLEVDETGTCINVWSNTWHASRYSTGKSLVDIWGHHAGEELIQLLKMVFTTNESRVMEFPSKENQEQRWFSARVSAIRFDDQKTACVLCRDITSQKQAEERLQRLAHYDVLTGLPNRAFLQDLLQVQIANGTRYNTQFAVLFIDLDRLKMINDSLGHAVGDQLIQAAANRIKECIREGDTVVRQSGDEFIVVLPNLIKLETANLVAQKILKNLTQPFFLSNHEVVVTGSIGISYFPKDSQDVDTLIKNADAAMYAAKESGRNNCQIFSPDMRVDGSRRLSLQHGLRRAIDRNEFSLHYQPQVDVITGKIVGAECLLRWNHPKLGLITPSTFIPVAEDTGLILPIGTWVLEEACRQYKEWQAAGLPEFLMAVNLSSIQFRQKNIVNTITSILDLAKMEPGQLDLELTEGTVMTHTEASIRTLQTLKAMGLCLSIDDFGTGYSSLSYLKRFPVDKLKIDQSFIRDIDHDPEDAAIASAVIALAKTLGLKVIAEGVESSEALRFLRDQHCDEMQGYLFSQPIPADQFATLLAANAANYQSAQDMRAL